MQSFNSAPVAFPCCLRNLQLRLPNGGLDLGPVETVPTRHPVEGRRLGRCCWLRFHTVLLKVANSRGGLPPRGGVRPSGRFHAGISGFRCACRPGARQPGLSPADTFSTGIRPITGRPSLLAPSYSPHPSAPLVGRLPVPLLAVGGWSGLPRSPERIDSPFRLRLSPGSRSDTASRPSTVTTNCFAVLAGANNCRRPVNAYEGSVDDSHALAMRVGSLAPLCPCNSDTSHAPLPDCASLTRGDIVDRASHPGVGPRRMPI